MGPTTHTTAHDENMIGMSGSAGQTSPSAYTAALVVREKWKPLIDVYRSLGGLKIWTTGALYVQA